MFLLQIQTCGMIRWEIFCCRCRHAGCYTGSSCRCFVRTFYQFQAWHAKCAESTGSDSKKSSKHAWKWSRHILGYHQRAWVTMGMGKKHWAFNTSKSELCWLYPLHVDQKSHVCCLNGALHMNGGTPKYLNPPYFSKAVNQCKSLVPGISWWTWSQIAMSGVWRADRDWLRVLRRTGCEVLGVRSWAWEQSTGW